MFLYLTRTSKESCMLTSKPPTITKVDGQDREKAFVSLGDPMGAKNLCIMGLYQVLPNLKLKILEYTKIEVSVIEV